jgi:hypothetical protein
MSPAKQVLKAVTPESVKVFMLVEAGIIGFLSYWIANEYVYNAYFHTYLDEAVLAHFATYTAALGVVIGVAGSLVAATFYRSFSRTRDMIDTRAVPKIRSAMDRILSGLPSLDENTPSTLREKMIREAIETPVPNSSRMETMVSTLKSSKAEN